MTDECAVTIMTKATGMSGAGGRYIWLMKMRKDIKNLEKYCEYCGKKLERKRFPSGALEDFTIFAKRKNCNMKCMGMARLKIGKGHDQSFGNAHVTARKIASNAMDMGTCQICGKNGKMDVHHVDWDYQNNTLDNLMIVCRSCHNKIHRPHGTCKICGNPVKGLGYCEKHYQRFKKYGNPLMVKRSNGKCIELEN